MATAGEVERAIVAGFESHSRADVRAALELYAGPESPRVQLAVLALAGGDPDRVLAGIEAACRDYRDPLYWAEHPEESSWGRVTRAEMVAFYRRLGAPVPEALRSSLPTWRCDCDAADSPVGGPPILGDVPGRTKGT